MKKIFRYLKRLWKTRNQKKFKSIGENCIVHYDSSVFSYDKITIGDNVFIGSKAHFSAFLKIGNNVMFGPGVIIAGGDHLFGQIGKSVRFLKPLERENSKDVEIEDEVWCGANVIILKGVTVGIGSVIGAGSVVTREVPPYTIVVGNPAKPVKKIFSDNELLKHLTLLGYQHDFAHQIIHRRMTLLHRMKLADIAYYNQICRIKDQEQF